MNQQDRSRRLKKYLEKVSPGIYDNRESVLEGQVSSEKEFEGLESSLEVLATDGTLTTQDSFGLEAIVHKKHRPAMFVINNTYDKPPEPWGHLGQSEHRKNIEKVIPLIGRIELPGSNIPYGGTGFVVGKDMIMTNRHVAEIFSRGLGTNNLRFKTGMAAGINFRKEVLPSPDVKDLKVIKIRMIHPHWDMALLHVEGLSSDQEHLSLSTSHTDDLVGRDIAVIGYPAQDPRNDIALQNEIFGGVYNVKRIQPGKLDPRSRILSFGQQVNAVTHDASTLGGNSGSAVIDPQTGQIIALHFAGIYLKANYAVPTYELARDQRVVDLGINFEDCVPLGNDWNDRWDIADNFSEAASSFTKGDSQPVDSGAINQTVQIGDGGNKKQVSITIPLTVTVSLGKPSGGNNISAAVDSSSMTESAELEGLFGQNRDQLIDTAYENSNVSFLGLTDYSIHAALTGAAASALAYSDDAEHIESICTSKLGFTSCKFFRNDNSECFIAVSTDTVLVSFRGTQGTRDWIANMNMVAQATEFGMVHGGFLKGFLDISTALEAELDSVLGSQKVVLTGHSLGGALSTIAASEWRHRYDIRSIYTFGQPSVGDRKFKENMEPFSDKFFRIVNDDDIVTKIPPTYRHVGKKIRLQSNRKLASQGIESPMISESTEADEMLSEAMFYQLQEDLDGSNQSIGTEGILPSFSDHKIANYIGKLLRLSQHS